MDSSHHESVVSREELEGELRSEIKHSLASCIRGLAILADLLEESLTADELDGQTLGEISAQMTTLTGEASQRLVDFSVPGGSSNG